MKKRSKEEDDRIKALTQKKGLGIRQHLLDIYEIMKSKEVAELRQGLHHQRVVKKHNLSARSVTGDDTPVE